MQRRMVQMFALVVAFLGIVGLFTEEYLFNLTNANLMLDVFRLGLAGYLIYAGFISDSARTIRTALVTFAMLYLGLAVLGMVDTKLWGLLPAGLTGFDLGFHLITGLIAGAAAMSVKDNRTAMHA